jgi:hypothetical protein
MAIPVLLAMLLALAGAVAFAAIAPAQAQAKGTTTVYVLTKANVVNKEDSMYNTLTYAYTKNGLLKTKKNAEKGNEKYAKVYSYKYTKKNALKSCSEKEGKELVSKTTYAVTKKGYVKKSVWADAWGEKSVKKYAYDKKGRLKQLTDEGNVSKYTYTSKSKTKTIKGKYVKETYKYDSHGYPTGYTTSYDEPGDYANTYKSGLLKKREFQASSWKEVITYKYKKINVPTSVAKMVEAQQYALITELGAPGAKILPFEAAHK